MGSKRLLIFTAAAAIALASYAPTHLTQSRTATTKQSDEAERAQNAANVLAEIMGAPDQSIP